ncbi:selenium metabolism membrane protein YedE/FdhT [Pseudomonas sp. BGr12]|uniref:selenium metabolism membrane protein YedE/FdhT n=1 Tax=unclassified Pseudomonas TaxID=196821 RepID=UPI0017877328|nr:MULTISPECIES: selenium metabolism membrane protein YedE/FdhT [unclassified Pseudomonas]MBD9503535.1 selenium metabolism membrane protein YedE/FdhT [Pseudomonas sp. PDM17]MBD9574017.1 selenium metabolism membrane protein YedE/FdhT [Pseudomonas sp. PDM23]MBD9671855.1 selenium metabolism membrane protein YedE/FdhT [Pseudomonas sp. PDM21]MDL2425479.1 selenium metabolism membrane protein YedE/FdhT [Pseudomonas sp. BJa5]
MSALSSFRERYLLRFWSPLPTLVALGVISAYYFAMTGTFWAVTGEFTRWGGHVLSWFGLQPQEWSYFKIIGLQGSPLDRIDGVMIIGMFLGALVCALWAGNVSLRWPTSKRRLLQGLIGGVIAGFGARLAMGCNLAAFFTGIPMFSVHAWAFMFSTVIGAWFGVKISLLPFLRIPLKVGGKAAALPSSEALARRAKLQWRLGMGVLAIAALFAVWRFEVSLVLGMACLFGLLFGGLIERAQICFTSAARDLWTTGRTQAALGILLGMAAACVGTFAAIHNGLPPKIFWMGPNAVIGGVLFGIGIVLAGGCETGWMYRSMEGQVHFWVVGVGNVIGGTLVAVYWDQLGTSLALPYPKLNLLQEFGPGGGLLITFAGLALCMLLVQLNAQRFTRKRKPSDARHQDADAIA